MTTTRAEQAQLVQKRLALLAKVMLILMAILCATQVLLESDDIWRGGYWLLVAGSVFWLVLYLYCRSVQQRSALGLRVFETVCILGWVACLGLAARLLMVEQFSDKFVADIVVLSDLGVLFEKAGATMLALFISLALVTRAATVPTGPRHTTTLTIAAGALYIVPWTIGSSVFDMPIYHLHESTSFFTVLTPVVIPLVLCWTITSIVCYLVSRVVHGLRVEIRDAQKLGQYTLLAKIGEGGMGVVYRARHAMMQRPTAIKLLSGGPDNIDFVRFEREVQLTTRLTHPNTITIFDYGRTPDGVFYYVMELLDGASLDAIVERDGPQPASRVVHILLQVTGALSEAHGIGLIHRDIKPANIILCAQGGRPDVAKVLDFGLVKEMNPGEDTTTTKADTITGTPRYLAPETIKDPANVDGRSDIYALGAVGYFLLTGEHVFSGNSVVELCAAHLHTKPVAPSSRTDNPVPPKLESLLLACLSKEPDERPASAESLAEQLRACDVGHWSDSDADTWWQSNRMALSQPTTELSGRTIAVDITHARK